MKKIKTDKCFILGDVHGEFPRLNRYMENLKKDFPDSKITLIQAGDFCFWPEVAPIEELKLPDDVEIFVCPGNHENWDYLDTFDYEITEMFPDVWYMPFGSRLDINGTQILFCGGADSIDKGSRKLGISWWPQELISYKDMAQLDDLWDIDIVISHTCPSYFNLGSHYKNDGYCKDPSRDALATVWDIYKPKKWFFGHYHMFKKGKYKNTNWVTLNMLGSEREEKWLRVFGRLNGCEENDQEVFPYGFAQQIKV